jgi:hypothetical protein
MSRANLAALAACLLGTLAAGCSLTQPKPKDFVLVDQRPAKAKESGNALEAAELACKEETQNKGVSSLVGIFSRLRKGSADQDYVACMKERGYEVKP